MHACTTISNAHICDACVWQILEVFDNIWNDDGITHKVKASEDDARAKGTAYTTVFRWSKTVERVRITKAANREYKQSLLRIDASKNARRVGKHLDMEKEVYRRFKEKRARNRKVSARSGLPAPLHI